MSGAGAALVLAQFLLIQLLMTAFTCSAMAGASVAGVSGTVICHGASVEVVAAGEPARHGTGSDGMCLDCPCGVACGAAAALLARWIAPDRDLGPAYRLQTEAIRYRIADTKGLPAPPPVSLRPDPTGPPILSA